MKNEIFCFKVVRNYVPGLYLSFFSSEYKGVYYELGKVTVPDYGCGPLAVFDSLENASNFVLYSCKKYYSTLAGYGVVSKHGFLWSNAGCKLDLPPGTILVDEFKPVIQVFA